MIDPRTDWYTEYMRRHVLWFLPLALTIVVAGCGSGDDAPPATQEAAQPTEDRGTGEDSGDGGGVAAAPGTGDFPASVYEGFPAEVPAGWEIDINGEIGLTDQNSAQLLYPADDFDGLVAFYDEWTESQPVEFAKTEVEGKVIYTGSGGSIYSITITPDEEQRDQTFALLQIITSGE